MALIKYTKVADHFKTLSDSTRVFLFFGEGYLVTQAESMVCDSILGKDKDTFAVETLDGTTNRMGDIIEQVATFSFFTPKKIIRVAKPPLFQAGTKSGDIKYTAEELDHLSSLITRGIPDNHFLIFTTAAADKRKKIFKTIQKHGCVVDCSVPLGNRKADLDEQQKVLFSVAGQILKKYGKSMSRQSFLQLADLTGFNLDLLIQNIEKLAAFTGKRPGIEPADIQAVIQRDKKDPLFHLTNAFLDKNTRQSIFYLTSLLKEGYHPLQILKALENQVRKLLQVKTFTCTLTGTGSAPLKTMSFNVFRQQIIPKVVQHDLKTKSNAKKLETCWAGQKGKKPDVNDLLLAPNPKNAYPVYQVFQKSEHFSYRELQDLMIYLSDLDYQAKSTAIDINTVIENLFIKTCSKGGFVYAAENKDRRHRF